MKKSGASQGQLPSELISKRIAELGDWRGETLRRMRTLIKEADPDVVEEWKWVKPTKPGTPVWSHDGIICTGESYKNVVKLTFARGASLKDPARLFNSSLDGNVRRAIDIHEGEEVDESAFKALVRQAVALNSSGKSKPSKKAKSFLPVALFRMRLSAPNGRVRARMRESRNRPRSRLRGPRSLTAFSAGGRADSATPRSGSRRVARRRQESASARRVRPRSTARAGQRQPRGGRCARREIGRAHV